MDKQLPTNTLLLIDFSILFDFSSITFALLKKLEEDKTNPFTFPNINLATFHIRTFKHFVDDYCKDNNTQHDELYRYIKSSPLYNNVKPKLYMLAQLVFLISNNLIKPENIFIYVEEPLLLDLVPQTELNLFKQLTSITTIHNINNNDEVLRSLFQDKTLIHFGDKHKINPQLITAYPDMIIVENAKTKPGEQQQQQPSSSTYYSSFDKFVETYFPTNHAQYTSHMSNEFILKYSKEHINKQFSYASLWNNYTTYDKQVLIEGKIVNGVKRGSKLLGIPTANIEMNNTNSDLVQQFINGVYFGNITFKTNTKLNPLIESKRTYKGVLSIGYNPFFNNNVKTIEVFLIDYDGDDFYGEEVSLLMDGYSRSEENFANLSELVTTISYDIILFNKILDTPKQQ